MALGSLCTVLEHGLDDHVSWWFMNGIAVWTRRSLLLVVHVLYWARVEDHMSW